MLRMLTVAVLFGLTACDRDDPPADDDDSSGDDCLEVTRDARVLILDQELRHHSSWIDVIDAFEQAGMTVD